MDLDVEQKFSTAVVNEKPDLSLLQKLILFTFGILTVFTIIALLRFSDILEAKGVFIPKDQMEV